MVRALAAIERGALQFTPQPAHGVTYAAKIGKAETRIDWTQAVASRCTTTSAGCRRFPAPGSSSAVCASRRCAPPRGEGKGAPGTVLDDSLTIACGDGAVRLTQVQRAGKQPMSAEEFLRGTKVEAGARLL